MPRGKGRKAVTVSLHWPIYCILLSLLSFMERRWRNIWRDASNIRCFYFAPCMCKFYCALVKTEYGIHLILSPPPPEVFLYDINEIFSSVTFYGSNIWADRRAYFNWTWRELQTEGKTEHLFYWYILSKWTMQIRIGENKINGFKDRSVNKAYLQS